MFGLFRRTKLRDWELQLLRNVITALPAEHSSLINQLNDGLIRGVLTNKRLPGHFGFTYHSDVFKKYERRQERDYRLTGINVFDNNSKSFLSFELFVSGGTICGYSLTGGPKAKIDVNKTEVSNYRKEYFEETDYNNILPLLTEAEKQLLNPSDVYIITIAQTDYYHILDLEDGDFLAIDDKKQVYKLTHDPMEVKLINMSLLEALKQ